MYKAPKCCGVEMKKNIETITFVEYKCEKCGNIIYFKKDVEDKPQLIDD
ncbi:MAG: hypothetical protein QXD48_01655 [Candidatus Aenigmatarchaeota archaeon]